MRVLAVIFLLHLLAGISSADIPAGFPYYRGFGHLQGNSAIPSLDLESPKDIEWFREKMKISPKYVEKPEGVLGMSWAHFFTMLFLLLLAAGGLVVFILRYKRTKEILALIKEGDKNGNKD